MPGPTPLTSTASTSDTELPPISVQVGTDSVSRVRRSLLAARASALQVGTEPWLQLPWLGSETERCLLRTPPGRREFVGHRVLPARTHALDRLRTRGSAGALRPRTEDSTPPIHRRNTPPRAGIRYGVVGEGQTTLRAGRGLRLRSMRTASGRPREPAVGFGCQRCVVIAVSRDRPSDPTGRDAQVRNVSRFEARKRATCASPRSA
jgi:hypothetical protein